MRRVCFELRVKPESIIEYTARHRAIWPEMLTALQRSGWSNYSLFMRPDGFLIGYFETEDLAAAQAAMNATEVNARWQAEMAKFFVAPDHPGNTGLFELTEVFNLEDQLVEGGFPHT